MKCFINTSCSKIKICRCKNVLLPTPLTTFLLIAPNTLPAIPPHNLTRDLFHAHFFFYAEALKAHSKGGHLAGNTFLVKFMHFTDVLLKLNLCYGGNIGALSKHARDITSIHMPNHLNERSSYNPPCIARHSSYCKWWIVPALFQLSLSHQSKIFYLYINFFT